MSKFRIHLVLCVLKFQLCVLMLKSCIFGYIKCTPFISTKVLEKWGNHFQFHSFSHTGILDNWAMCQNNFWPKALSKVLISSLKAISLECLDIKLWNHCWLASLTHGLDRFFWYASCSTLFHQDLHNDPVIFIPHLHLPPIFIWPLSVPNLCLCILLGNTISGVYLISMNVI